MGDEEVLEKIGKKYGKKELSINDLERAIRACSIAQDFRKKTFSFNRQVLLEVFKCNSLSTIDQDDRKIISKIVRRLIACENKEPEENQTKERLKKQCNRDLEKEAKRAGFKEYDELDKHLTIH